MVELNDLIHIYDDILSLEVCNFLVDFFEKNQDKSQQGEGNFLEINLTTNRELSSELDDIHNSFIKNAFEYKKKYYEFIDSRVFPDQHAFEYFKIKKYKENDLIDTHVDVINHETSRRFLYFCWFLNDVESGGELQFKDIIISPRKSRLVIFPPLWMFPYKELPVTGRPKYTISTYLHYK